MIRLLWLTVVASMAVVCGCSPMPPPRPDAHNPAQPANRAESSASRTSTGNAEVTITAEGYGSEWPFTVDRGVLARRDTGVTVGATRMCEVLFTAKGVTYAVNGTAKGAKRYADIRRIWADDPLIPGAKKNIGPIIDHGLSLVAHSASSSGPVPAARRSPSTPSPPRDLAKRVRSYNKLLAQLCHFAAELRSGRGKVVYTAGGFTPRQAPARPPWGVVADLRRRLPQRPSALAW